MAKYDCDESITLSAEQEKSESDMKQRILFLEKLAKAKRDEVNCKFSEDQKYESELLVLMKQMEEWKQTAERNEKNLSKTRSEMEAQIKLMQSKEDMVQARDQQINTLNNAYHLTEAAASNKPSEGKKKGSIYGIQVTSVLDNRYGFSNPKIYHYKHRNPLVMDFRRVDEEPV